MWMEVLCSSGFAPLPRRSSVSDSQKMSGIVGAEENRPGIFLWNGRDYHPLGPTSRTGSPPRILFLITEDNYFWANRLNLARKLRDLGAEVWVMTRVQSLAKELGREGFYVVPWQVSRKSLNPIREALAFLQVVRAYREVAPDLVHQIALKPIVYGGLAARFRGETSAINMIIGLGHAFLSDSIYMRITRQFLLPLLRFSLRKENSKTIFQNRGNLEDILRTGAVKDNQCILIRGDGVNLERFSPRPEPDGIPVVILAGRLLWTKGVREFVQAAQLLRSRDISARFVLVGGTDHANPASIPEAEVRSWVNSKLVEWWGHRDDMPNVFAQANLVCLPSYGEGAPNALMEAAACGRAVVASDVPGCRDVVRHGETGLLVPARDSADLAGALAMLIENSDLRARMGARGRELAVREYSVDIILNQMLSVYRELLGSRLKLCDASAKDAA
jgi:glycosyltransferase involved in cell wall biosynthesis